MAFERSTAIERKARSETTLVIADLRGLAGAEKRDLRATFKRLQTLQERAQDEAATRHLDDAIAHDREATLLARQELNGLVDELVKSYGEMAQRATEAKEFGIAQQALDRARQVRAMKREVRAPGAATAR